MTTHWNCEDDEIEEASPSKFVLIMNLDFFIGASSVYEMFQPIPEFQYGEGLVDIVVDNNVAVAEFKSAEIAKEVIQIYNDQTFG